MSIWNNGSYEWKGWSGISIGANSRANQNVFTRLARWDERCCRGISTTSPDPWSLLAGLSAYCKDLGSVGTWLVFKDVRNGEEIGLFTFLNCSGPTWSLFAGPMLISYKLQAPSTKHQAPSPKPQAAATFCRASLYSLTQTATIWPLTFTLISNII